MKFFYVPVAICVCTFVYLQTVRARDPLEMLLKLRHIKLQMLKLWRCSIANENTEGAERMSVVSELLTCLTR
jgi:hypothetical protein